MDELRQLLTSDQIRQLHRRSAWRGTWALLVNWALVAAGFAIAIRWPTVLGVVVALVLLGGRQLGLGILMHDGAHRSLFSSPSANDRAGQWLCAAPIFADLEVYRRYHMTHHRLAGTEDDPDLPNYRGYPVTRASLARKFARDLLGLTGARAAMALALLYAHEDPSSLRLGYSYRRGTIDGAPRSVGHLLWNLRRVLLAQAMGVALLWALGHPLAYLLWPAAWLTTYMLFSRIRNAAEHGGLPGTATTDPWANTRSVKARWWERLTVAPNHVAWHFEHHLAPAVPGYRLQALHDALVLAERRRTLPLWSGYGAVLRDLAGA